MKPTPPPPIAGKTGAERFDNALRKVLSAPHSKSAPEKTGTPPKPTK